jgi:hypothetical protein
MVDELLIVRPTAEQIKQARTFIDWSGKRVGRLLVLGRSGRKCRNEYKWVCRCDCGRLTAVWRDSLKKSSTMSCGCLQKILTSITTSNRGRKVCKCGAPIEKRYYRNAGMCKRCRYEYGKKWMHVPSAQLRDCYIRQLLRDKVGLASDLPIESLPRWLIDGKRELVKAKRLLKEIKDGS